jgi:DNA-binding NarL/FixJ family response regulator
VGGPDEPGRCSRPSLRVNPRSAYGARPDAPPPGAGYGEPAGSSETFRVGRSRESWEGTTLRQVTGGPIARVLIVDGETLFRVVLARLLEEAPDILVVGQAAEAVEALRLVPEVQPDVLVMELRMDEEAGLRALRGVLERHPEVKVLVLSRLDGMAYVVGAMRAGASGYLLKSSDPEQVAAGIRAAVAGLPILPSSLADRVLRLLTGDVRQRDDCDGLTDRELEVLRLVAAGTAYEQIAHMLRISQKTVRAHVCHIYDKLAIRERTQVVRYALRKGLVEP